MSQTSNTIVTKQARPNTAVAEVLEMMDAPASWRVDMWAGFYALAAEWKRAWTAEWIARP
jgi:hypothetical protein